MFSRWRSQEAGKGVFRGNGVGTLRPTLKGVSPPNPRIADHHSEGGNVPLGPSHPLDYAKESNRHQISTFGAVFWL
ncbi:hypothetical protein Oscil6304_2531 [Oscillatoria acuminata PCC 6304]|uniref:Uncharacterized protein n=1 Tax=Oscillatoria acuminata PCC 6304 TaxID=56110 RepID=K9TJE9_9CYAN|nr:hypothetical protein Oscil6304_2531 [Oscillatoria acuminata PCC 6304]